MDSIRIFVTLIFATSLCKAQETVVSAAPKNRPVDMTCSTIDDCKQVGYCNFLSKDGHTSYGNTCCLRPSIKHNLPRAFPSESSNQRFCYCCDGIGTTCEDSRCVRYTTTTRSKKRVVLPCKTKDSTEQSSIFQSWYQIPLK